MYAIQLTPIVSASFVHIKKMTVGPNIPVSNRIIPVLPRIISNRSWQNEMLSNRYWYIVTTWLQQHWGWVTHISANDQHLRQPNKVQVRKSLLTDMDLNMDLSWYPESLVALSEWASLWLTFTPQSIKNWSKHGNSYIKDCMPNRLSKQNETVQVFWVWITMNNIYFGPWCWGPVVNASIVIQVLVWHRLNDKLLPMVTRLIDATRRTYCAAVF